VENRRHKLDDSVASGHVRFVTESSMSRQASTSMPHEPAASSQEFQLDPVSYAGIGACLFALAGWLHFAPQQIDSSVDLVEVSGSLLHVVDWKPAPRRSAVTVLQVAESRIRITTNRVSTAELQKMMQSSKVSIQAKVSRSHAVEHEESPVVPARALWIDGNQVLTLGESQASDESSSRFATIFALFTALAGFFMLLKAYALHRQRVEA
jgi:hypothetical protein